MDLVRRKNLSLLEARGFRVVAQLPRVRWSPQSLRPAEEIAAMTMALVAMFFQVTAPETAVPTSVIGDWIRRNRLDRVMGPRSQELFALSRTRAQANFRDVIGWRLENLWPLIWALGFEPTPDVDGRMVGLDFLMPGLPSPRETVADVVSRGRVRTFEEVDALHDLFYCAHNAVRSAQQGSDTLPRGFHPVANGGVVHERRHALTYVLSHGVAWDDVDLST